MKLAVVVGHNRSSPGAWAVSPISRSEYDFNTDVAEVMSELDHKYGLDVRVFWRQPVGSYSTEIARVYGAVDNWGADASMELHFNAFTSSSTGTETLYSGSSYSKRFATAVQKQMVDTLGLRDRGLKHEPGGRGWKSLIAGKAPAILTEPFFGSNPNDCQAAARLGVVGFAKMYLEGAKHYAG